MSATCLHSTAAMSLPKSRYGPKDRSVLGPEANVQARTDEREREGGDRGNDDDDDDAFLRNPR
jgi:hypothetical protein